MKTYLKTMVSRLTMEPTAPQVMSFSFALERHRRNSGNAVCLGLGPYCGCLCLILGKMQILQILAMAFFV